ncbi:MAG: hypothetical protein IJL87_05580 [Clostridia bacterium]|nr:hypothetical protein [Clostridia bacterium]
MWGIFFCSKRRITFVFSVLFFTSFTAFIFLISYNYISIEPRGQYIGAGSYFFIYTPVLWCYNICEEIFTFKS